MQNSTTILGIIEMRLKGISYDDCRNRYGVGNSLTSVVTPPFIAFRINLLVLLLNSAAIGSSAARDVYTAVLRFLNSYIPEKNSAFFTIG